MSIFSISNPYPSLSEDEPPDRSDIEIDENVLDIDAQELFQEINSINLDTVQRELADATLALQKRTRKRWTNYYICMKCSNPKKLLRKAECELLIGYFL